MDGFGLQIAVILGFFGLTAFLTGQVRRYLLARNLLDKPNERSSHTIPTPRGGGWAIILVILPFLLGLSALNGFDRASLCLLAASLLLTLISWQDDRQGVRASVRLLLHVIAASIGSLAFPLDQTLLGGILPPLVDRTIMIIGWAWFMNLYNFMDGIDGITGVETISLATGACLVLSTAGITAPLADSLTLALTGCGLGFLVLNWQPAKIFMGDIGSVPMGFLSGFILITLATHGQIIPALLLALYYLADSGITITKRALRGEKVWEAHRQHFYQRAAKGLGRHDRVVYGIIAANIVLIVAAMLAVSMPILGTALGVTAVAILLRWMHNCQS